MYAHSVQFYNWILLPRCWCRIINLPLHMKWMGNATSLLSPLAAMAGTHKCILLLRPCPFMTSTASTIYSECKVVAYAWLVMWLHLMSIVLNSLRMTHMHTNIVNKNNFKKPGECQLQGATCLCLKFISAQ